MTPNRGVRARLEAATRDWTLPSKLTMAVVPIALAASLAGGALVWLLIESDDSSGFSAIDAAAIGLAVLLFVVAVGSVVGAFLMGRSLAARIDQVSTVARRVASEDLANLIDALRGPDADIEDMEPLHLETDAQDEVGDLARSFEELHQSLVDVAARQMEALRGGVSKIFVTLARRNTSLVDRQLALLDELESREEDPVILGGYYKVDHFATRMRRNAESLLVLAGAEPPRVWAKSMDMSDVVRAAVSEVDDYQRVELLALEPAMLSGGAVADVAHLFAELLDNATQFSPPSETVRVTGLFDMDGYQLSVTDRGVGLSNARIAELNGVLESPPALGLAIEPTLGIYVVARLAARHGIKVDLMPAVPGVTVKVTIPRDLLETKRTRPPSREGSIFASDQIDLDAEYADPATREYVFKRIRRESVVKARSEVIDLTEHAMTGPDPEPAGSKSESSRIETVAGEEDSKEVGDLPVRTPGRAYQDQDSGVPSTAPGDGAIGIKSALSAYDRGRRAAESDDQPDGVDDGAPSEGDPS